MSKRGLAGLMVWMVGTLCSIGCSNPLAPSEVVGDWSGRDGSAHFASIEIRFEQRGSAVVGTACRYDGASLTFTGVPVTVDHSSVTFIVHPEGPNAHTFAGRFASDGKTLIGAFTSSPSDGPSRSGSPRASAEIVMARGGNLCAGVR